MPWLPLHLLVLSDSPYFSQPFFIGWENNKIVSVTDVVFRFQSVLHVLIEFIHIHINQKLARGFPSGNPLRLHLFSAVAYFQCKGWSAGQHEQKLSMTSAMSAGVLRSCTYDDTMPRRVVWSIDAKNFLISHFKTQHVCMWFLETL